MNKVKLELVELRNSTLIRPKNSLETKGYSPKIWQAAVMNSKLSIVESFLDVNPNWNSCDLL